MNQFFKGILFFTASAILAVQAPAAPVECAANGSFAGLQATNAGGGCYIDDHVFSNFSYASTGVGIPAVTANNFLYSVVASAPSWVGFQFGFTLTALPNTSGSITVEWLVESDNIVNHRLVLNALASDGVAIAQTEICEGGPVAACPGAVKQLEAYDAFWGNITQDQEFFSPIQVLGVRTSMNVFGGLTNSATITGLRQTVDPPSNVPEPASLALTGGALVSLYFIRRRRS